MMQNKVTRKLNERLDLVASELVRAASMTEAEAESAADSQWLFTRTRNRIAAEIERRETGDRWSVLMTVLRRAVPATGLAAALAFGMFIYEGGSSPSPAPTSEPFDQALFQTNDAGVQHVVFAERRQLSPDEVLETIINPEREASK